MLFALIIIKTDFHFSVVDVLFLMVTQSREKKNKKKKKNIEQQRNREQEKKTIEK
jgi:DNA-binding MurR/RpiR family transcriptional regulator